jgi:hypothetical protein
MEDGGCPVGPTGIGSEGEIWVPNQIWGLEGPAEVMFLVWALIFSYWDLSRGLAGVALRVRLD